MPSAISRRRTRWRGCSAICRGDRRDPRARRAARIHDGRSRLPLSGLPGACRRDDGVVPAQDDAGGRARALPAVSRSGAPPGRARARSDREARSRRLLPDRLGHRQLLPPGGHPGAGPRIGGQQRGVLQPRHHRRRSGRHGPAVRALPVRGARRVARHRSRSAERRSPRAGDSAHLREVRHGPVGNGARGSGSGSGLGSSGLGELGRIPPKRPRSRAPRRAEGSPRRATGGNDRQRHHVSRPQRRARSWQSAVARSPSKSIGWRR